MEKIKCEICGQEFIKPLSHVWQKHGMSAKDYKKQFGYDLRRGIIPWEHKVHLRNVQSVEALKNLDQGDKFDFKKGDPKLGKYPRSRQTMERLKNHFKKERAEKVRHAMGKLI